jgi:RNA polymerase sigma-70 factor (ECF subfamily)
LIVREEFRVLSPLNGLLDQVYRDDGQRLFTCALAITRSVERAEDAVHEAFYRLCRLSKPPRNLRAYVFRAVRNAAIDQRRKNPPSVEAVPDFIFDLGPGPCEAAIDNEFQRRVAETLIRLSEDECETIVQHLYGNLTFREIAEIRGAPTGTVTSWYQRGLDKLRAKLE